MRNKPWFVILIALCHLLEPLFSWIFWEVFFNTSLVDLFMLIIRQGNYFELWRFFLFPMAGIVIFAYKKWSLPVFWLIELIAFVSNLGFMLKAYETGSYQILAVCLILFTTNIVVTTYLLLPIVRRSFFDQSLHWWRSKRRFTLDVKGVLTQEGQDYPIQLVNISESGLFAKIQDEKQRVSLGEDLIVAFEYDEFSFALKAKAVHFHEGHCGYGLQLKDLKRSDKKQLRALTKLLRERGLITDRDRLTTYDELFEWLRSPTKLANILPRIRS